MNNYFFTLTYDEENEPWEFEEGFDSYPKPSVSKRDVQLFFKRLRKYLTFRYIIVSEYGPKTYRPHYHGILFVAAPTPLQDIERLVQKSWKLGLVDVGLLRDGGAAYCSKYLFKKQPDGTDYFRPCFLLASRRPAIGVSSISPNLRKFLVENEQTYFPLANGRKVPLPRIFATKIFTSEHLSEIRKKHKDAFEASFYDKYLSEVVRHGSPEAYDDFRQRAINARRIAYLRKINNACKKNTNKNL